VKTILVDEEIQVLPEISDTLESASTGKRTLDDLKTKNLVSLLFSTVTAELAGNVVYVMLMERAFASEGSGAGVGLVLVIQSWAGMLTDRVGTRKASIVGLIAQAILAFGLTSARSIWTISGLAFFITLTRSFILPARLALITRVSDRAGFVKANIAISALTGLGLFLGPALAAALALISKNSTVPLLVAAVLLLSSSLPIITIFPEPPRAKVALRVSIFAEMRQIWQFLTKHRPLWQILICFSFSTMTFGAIVPLLTPLARQFEFGSEGSGILVAALGFGWTVGPLLASALFKWRNITGALLITGILTPLTALTIAFIPNISGVLIALATSSIAGAALNVMVTTILCKHCPGSCGVFQP
jgi:predicted MFS family arabinose efflux permease